MLLERGQHLDTLQALSAKAHSGLGQIALVYGEAGIGKTSLLRTFTTDNYLPPGLKPLWGHCDALSTPRTLGPIRDVKEELKLNFDQERFVNQSAVFSQVLNALERSSHVLIFEDVHWADDATLDFIKYLGRRIENLNVLFILSFRDGENAKHGFKERVIGDLPQKLISRMHLKPLSKNAVQNWVQSMDGAAEDIYEKTAGNPFFISELLFHDAPSLPDSVLDSVHARLARLPNSVRDIIELISVFPTVLPLEYLMKLLGADKIEALDICFEGNILELQNNEVRFRHALVRDAVQTRLSISKKIELNKKVLSRIKLKDIRTPLETFIQIADQAYDGMAVLDVALEAAERAANLGAHQEATSHLSTALRYVDMASPELAAELYERWAYEAGLSENIDMRVLDARRQAITLWRALGRPDKVGENLRWLSRLHWYRGESADANRLADQAVSILEDTKPCAERVMAYSLKSQLYMLNSEMELAEEWALKALSLEKQHNNLEARIHALNNLGVARLFMEHPDGINHMKESLKLSLKHNFHEHAARVYTNLSEHAIETRDFELANQICAEGIEFDKRHDLDSWTFYLMGLQSELLMEQGKFSEARKTTQSALRLTHQTMLMKQPARTTFAFLEMRSGRKTAKDLFQEAYACAQKIGEVQYLIPVLLGKIELGWLTGNRDFSFESLKEINALDTKHTNKWVQGEIAVWNKRLTATFTGEMSCFPEPHALELDGDFEKASKSWKDLGLIYRAAFVRMLKPHPNFNDIEFVINIASPMGANALTNVAIQTGKSIGMDPSTLTGSRGPNKDTRQNRYGLTNKEQQVFDLLKLNMTNQQIANELNRSRRTVEVHVSSILKKLGVKRRFEAILFEKK